ncbi:hypothetical protein D3C87_1906290 [compost metagenome]
MVSLTSMGVYSAMRQPACWLASRITPRASATLMTVVTLRKAKSFSTTTTPGR